MLLICEIFIRTTVIQRSTAIRQFAGVVENWKGTERMALSCACHSDEQDHRPHYSDAIMNAIASQITGPRVFTQPFVQRKHQSSASLAFLREIPLAKDQ